MIDLTKLTEDLVRQHNAGPKLSGADGSETLPPDSECGAAVETALGEAPFVCDECGEWKQSGEMHRDSNGRRILCMDCGWKESPNAQRDAYIARYGQP